MGWFEILFLDLDLDLDLDFKQTATMGDILSNDTNTID